jgi:hypothetical protein
MADLALEDVRRLAASLTLPLTGAELGYSEAEQQDPESKGVI